ncbi:phage protein NinX family protein [Xenorhabdus sp. KJ12.1]|uniref:phage protein NinX family protein n=1 Tax=Xenorhabdus sp. KJ12.1 TaxID=1851571 RepID=UPI000C048132|nr:phage protein NinX family protein [Xenorhabdus sp. KJ12.1]PHM72325.1 hypothetical protein Xekj_00603 [Xenorhabdus sp. KJ12.1]
MKIKTSELTGRALDWAVAVAIGATEKTLPSGRKWMKLSDSDYYVSNHGLYNFDPSTDWAQCGQLIEKYDIYPSRFYECSENNLKKYQAGTGLACMRGETQKIAVCRAVVATELGREIDIPDELIEKDIANYAIN